MNFFTNFLIFSFISLLAFTECQETLLSDPVALGTSTKLNCSDETLDGFQLLYWVTPTGRVLNDDHNGSKYSVFSNKELKVEDVENQDVGIYTCIVQDSTRTNTLVEYPVMIPYAYPVKDYLASFLVGFGAALIFLVLAVGVVLLDKYKWQPPEEKEENIRRYPVIEDSTLPMAEIHIYPKQNPVFAGAGGAYGNPAADFTDTQL